MQDTRPFSPFYKVTIPNAGAGSQQGTLIASVKVAATAAGAAASGVLPGANRNGVIQMRIANQSLSGWAYVNFGVFGSVVAATTADSYPVAPGAVEIVTVDPEVTGASVILSTGTGDVVFTRGSGV